MTEYVQHILSADNPSYGICGELYRAFHAVRGDKIHLCENCRMELFK